MVLLPAGLLLAVAFDLHRLQPWAYQFALLALVFAVGPWAGSIRWLRAFVISIYLYSAVGKFDAQFLHTVGPQLLQAAAKFIGIDAAGDPAGVVSSVWVRGSLIFPITELIAALLLACPPRRLPHARTAGRWLATAMHLTLIVLLGPLGLGHRWGVLAWNLFFIGQAWILFRDDRPEDATDASADSTSDHNRSPAPPVRAWIARAAIVVAMVWPLTERWGYCDHWLAWALYSPHSSRAELLILPQAQDRLPTELQELLVPAADVDSLGEWLRLPLDQWSLRDLQAPIYPQARFQADVARQTVQRYGLDGVCRLRVWSAAERWSGRRDLVYDGPP